MIRNIVLGVALCPPLAAILLVLVSLVFGAFMAHPPLSPTAPAVPSTYSNPGFSPLPGMFITLIFFSYFFGWLPCLIIGLGNGVADVVVRSLRNRLLLAPAIGAFVAYTTLLLIPASGTVWEHLVGATPFAIAAAIASLICAAIANNMRAGKLNPTAAS